MATSLISGPPSDQSRRQETGQEGEKGKESKNSPKQHLKALTHTISNLRALAGVRSSWGKRGT